MQNQFDLALTDARSVELKPDERWVFTAGLRRNGLSQWDKAVRISRPR